jgi:hypothetical protein
MSRKRPSRHSEDQFALFLERISDSLGSEDDAKFNEAVSSLIRRRKGDDQKERNGPDCKRTTGGQAARDSSSARQTVRRAVGRESPMARLGGLVVDWTNNEGLLLRLLTLLLGTDEKSATVVQSILNTTQARLELVRRLALVKVVDPSLRRSLETVLDRFRTADRLREELLRADIADGRLVDEDGMNRLEQVLQELRTLNLALSDLLPQLCEALAAAERGAPELDRH